MPNQKDSNTTAITPLIPTHLQIAEAWSLVEEMKEFNYRKIRPYAVMIFGTLTSLIILQPENQKQLINLFLPLVEMMLSPEDKQKISHYVAENDESYTKEDFSSFSNSKEFMWVLGILFISQVVFYLPYHYLTKYVAKKLITYFGNNKDIADLSVRQYQFSQQEIIKVIENLKAGLNTTKEILEKINSYLSNIVIVFIFFFWVRSWQDLTNFENRIKFILSPLMFLLGYAKLEKQWESSNNDKLLEKKELQLKQLTEIIKPLKKQWIPEEISSARHLYLTFDFSKDKKIQFQGEPLAKPAVLKILKKLFVQYQCTIIVYDPNNGIIISPEEIFSKENLDKIKKDLNAKLIDLSQQEQNINLLKKQLNSLSRLLNESHQSWIYYPEENYFALNVINVDDFKIKGLITALSFLKDKFQYDQDSAYFTITNLTPIDNGTYKKAQNFLRSYLTSTSVTTVPIETRAYKDQLPENYITTSVSDAAVVVENKKKSKQSLKEEKALSKKTNQSSKEIIKSTYPIKSCESSENSKDLYPIFSPNLKTGTHFSSFNVKNEGIMAENFAKNKTYYSKFFEIVQVGRMGGSGNCIKKLKKEKKVTDLFKNTITATHKLRIKSKDMRIFGTMKKEGNKNIIDFCAVQPSHKWATRK